MTKKQKNRKTINQNFRNKLLNRKYSSLTKFFFKKLKAKLFLLKKVDINLNEKLEILSLKKRLESILDKSVNRNVIHKNKRSRKKSQIFKLIKKIF